MKNIWFIDISYWPEVLTGLLEVVFEEGTPFQQVKTYDTDAKARLLLTVFLASLYRFEKPPVYIFFCRV